MTEISDTSLNVESAAEHILKGLLSEEPEEKKVPEGKVPPAKSETTDAEAAPDETESVEEEATPDAEETATDDDVPQPKPFKVKIDGQEVEVTEDELLKGYSRHEDYTRKTQRLADEKKAFETESTTKAQEIATRRAEYEARLASVHDALRALTPEEPNWDELRKVHSSEDVNAAYIGYKQQQERLAKIQGERDRLAKESNAALAKEAEKYLSTERERLRDVIPEWKDPVKEQAGLSELTTYAKSIGFTEEELASVVDHRLLLVLRKAQMQDRGTAAKPTIENKIERVIAASAPGASSAAKPSTALAKAQARLKQTGRLEDAASLIERML